MQFFPMYSGFRLMACLANKKRGLSAVIKLSWYFVHETRLESRQSKNFLHRGYRSPLTAADGH